MSIVTAFAIYFLMWWVMLFAVLPFGIRSQHESGGVAEGTEPGAPAAPKLWLRLLATTIASAVVFAILATVYVNRWFTFEQLLDLLGMPR